MSPPGGPLLRQPWILALLGGVLSVVVALAAVGSVLPATGETPSLVAAAATPTPAQPAPVASAVVAPTATLPVAAPPPTTGLAPATPSPEPPPAASPTPWLLAASQPDEPTPEPPAAPAAVPTELAPEPAAPAAPAPPLNPAPANEPGQPARMVIPRLRLDQRVRDVFVVNGAWQVADWAVGHHTGSALLGQRGNAVFSGHNNINGEVFRYLDRLEEGDRIDVISTDGRTFSYDVSEKIIVLDDGASPEQQAKNASYMYPTRDERITLLSCWPYQPWPPYRIIIIARPAG